MRAVAAVAEIDTLGVAEGLGVAGPADFGGRGDDLPMVPGADAALSAGARDDILVAGPSGPGLSGGSEDRDPAAR